MSELVTLRIDDVEVSVPKGTLIVDAAKKIGNDIPVFCYHPKLEPVGMCRMCLVEVGTPKVDPATKQPVQDEGGQPVIAWMPKLQTSCTMPVSPGMVVRTKTAQVGEARDDIIEFLLTSHPLDCPICDKGGECPLQNLTMAHGPGKSRFLVNEKFHLAKHVPLGTAEDALIYLDRERCIQCARCTRFQDEVVDDHVIGFFERGRHMEIVTFSEPGFDSVFSGNTTDICPVGALTSADFRFEARPWEMKASASICPHCPVGCNTTLNTRRQPDAGGRTTVQRVMPRQNEQVNEIWICDKGRFGHHYAHSGERLQVPLVRKNGALVEASWDEALDLVASKFKAAGAGLVGIAGDRASNEDLYNFRMLVEGVGGRVELNNSMGGGDLVQQVGVGVGTNLGSMGAGTAILVVASDLEEEAPIWWLRVKQAADRGATLIVLNGRETKTDRYAAHRVRYRYGDEAATVLAMLNASAGGKPGVPSQVSGYKADDAVKAAANAFAGATDAVILFGQEGLGFADSQALAQACANLLIATNHFGRPNNGLIGVWPRANTQGAWDMGVRPTGRPMADVVKGAKAVIVMASDPAGDDRSGAIGEALRKAEFVVVQELFLTETANLADVVLPAQSFIEREGTFTNGERRVQRFYPAAPAQGETKADYWIAAEIGNRAGIALKNVASLAMHSIAESVPAYMGVTYNEVAKVAPQWPIVGGRDLYYGGTQYKNSQGLGVQVKSAAERGETPKMAWLEPPKRPKGEGITVVPVRVLYDRGITFSKSELVQPRVPRPYVEINTADAEKMGVQDGGTVTLKFEDKTIKATARVNGRVPKGVAIWPQNLEGPKTVESGVPIPAAMGLTEVAR